MSVSYNMPDSYIDAMTFSKVLPGVIRLIQFIEKLGLALQLMPVNILHILLFPGNSSSNSHSMMPISSENSLMSFSVTSHSSLRLVGVSDLGIGVFVGTDVFVGASVFVGSGVFVGSDVFVGKGVDVDGIGVGAGAHPLTKTARNTNAKKIDPPTCWKTR